MRPLTRPYREKRTTDDLRRRGEELQATLPEPSPRALERAARREERAGPIEAALGSIDFFGFWGALLAVPAAVMWWISRRLRRR